MGIRPEGHSNIGEGHRHLHLRRQYCLALKDPIKQWSGAIKSILFCCNSSHLCHLGNLRLQGITTTKMTVRNRIVKAEKTERTVISEEITEAVINLAVINLVVINLAVISVEAPEAGHVTEEWTPEERTLEDPVLDLESENPAIIGKDLDHVIVKKDKDLDQEKAGNPIMFGGRDPQGGTGNRGDQDQLNVIETVGNEPRTVRRKAEMYHPTTQS